MPEYVIVSMRDILGSPAQACLTEFETVLIESCSGTLLLPRRRPRGRGPFPRNRTRPFEARIPPRGSSERVAIVVLLSLAFAPGMLESLPGLRSQFDRIALYIFEPYVSGSEGRRKGVREAIRQYTDFYRKNVDMVFVSMSGGVGPVAQQYGVPVHFVPAACDVLRFGANRPGRMIDVNGYGRQDQELIRLLERRMNDPAASRFFYHTGPGCMPLVRHAEAQRRIFWKFLTHSRIGLAYDPMTTNENGRFPYSFIALRWFEMITAGCLIAGRRPTCPEMDDLFTWEDSTVELPGDPEQAADALGGLLDDPERIEAAHRRNLEHALAAHDWRHRIATMLDLLDLPHPDPLRRGLEALASATPGGSPPRSSA